MPGEGVAARIELLSEYAPGLAGIELSSHVIVLGWLDQTRREVQRDITNGSGEGPLRGSFATRVPTRPNPIALTIVRLAGRDGSTLQVEGLDLIDGTPVLDVKPYIPGQDCVFSATRGWRSRTAMGPEQLRGYLEPELCNHLGRDADLPAARAVLEAVLLAAARLGTDPRNQLLSARINRSDAAADALMGLLGATLASGRITIEPDPAPLGIVFTLGGATLELVWHGTGEAAETRGEGGEGGDAAQTGRPAGQWLERGS